MGISIADANANAVRQAGAAWNGNRFAKLTTLLHRTVAWFPPGRSAVAAEAFGRAAVLARFAKHAYETGGTFRVRLIKALRSAAGGLVAIHYDRGEGNGKRPSAGCCDVFDFEDGLIPGAGEKLSRPLHLGRILVLEPMNTTAYL